METLSWDSIYAHLKFGFDLASAYLSQPAVILVLIASLFVVWRLLTPQR